MQDDLRKIILCRDVMQGIKQCIGFINEYCHARSVAVSNDLYLKIVLQIFSYRLFLG